MDDVKNGSQKKTEKIEKEVLKYSALGVTVGETIEE